MKTVNHVSAHLSTMCPVHTAKQKKVSRPPGRDPANRPQQRERENGSAQGRSKTWPTNPCPYI